MDHLQHVERQTMTLSQAPSDATVELPSFDEARSQFIRSYLSQILQMTGGNVSQAAKLAKRNRTDFYKLLQRYVLVPSDFKIG
jgi:two-component system response regulator GlrR